MECYGDIFFVVLCLVCYCDKEELIEFGELYLFVGFDFVVMIWYVELLNFVVVCVCMEVYFEFFVMGLEVVFYVIFDEVVDGYELIVVGLLNDIDEIED